MSDQWTNRLSEYLDGDLDLADRRRLEEHLMVCPACQVAVEDLRRVVARAQALEDREPAGDLWPGIAQGIGAAAPAVVELGARRRRGLRVTFSLPQLAAAAAVLMLVSAGSVTLLRWETAGRRTAVAPGMPAATGVAPVVMVEGTYDAAVVDLERVLEQGRGWLDTATVRVLEQNLRIIDGAIAECRRALAADPASPYLNAHLAETMKQKLDLLRQAARLTSART